MNKQTMTQNICSALRAERAARELNQSDVAQVLNMCPSAYAAIERGDNGISAIQLWVLAEAYGIEPKVFYERRIYGD